jgi:hypothetical protein
LASPLLDAAPMRGIKNGTLAPGVVLAVVASVAACQHDTFHGELGRAEFEWSFCGLGGCDHSPALAPGATGWLEVYNASSLPAFDVSSTDASILVFSWTYGRPIQVSAVATGTAKLVLTDHASGEVIDRLSLSVKNPSKIVTSPAGSLAMMGGPLPVSVHVTLDDAGGTPMIASGAVAYAADPGITVTVEGDEFLVSTTAPGTAGLSLIAGAASTRLNVINVLPQDVAKVTIFPIDRGGLSGVGDTGFVVAQALLGDGSVVYAPQLSWASSNPACLQVEDDPDPPKVGDDRTDARLRVIALGCSARISASSGSATASAVVSM